MRKWKTVVAAGAVTLTITGAGGAAPASASDETLKAAITQVIPEITPTLDAFSKEAKRATSSGDLAKLRQATIDVRTGIHKYEGTVVNYKASTARGLAAKKQLLVAIREYDIGFAAYGNALDKLRRGASKASTLSSLRSFARRLEEAAKDEAVALRALGIDG